MTKHSIIFSTIKIHVNLRENKVTFIYHAPIFRDDGVFVVEADDHGYSAVEKRDGYYDVNYVVDRYTGRIVKVRELKVSQKHASEIIRKVWVDKMTKHSIIFG